jgi:hypothetical protein
METIEKLGLRAIVSGVAEGSNSLRQTAMDCRAAGTSRRGLLNRGRMMAGRRWGERRRLFGEDGGFQFLDPRGMLVELRLNDLVEAAIDGGKAVVHFFTETADLIVYVGADVLAFFFDEARQLLKLGLFVFWHAGQYTIPGRARRRRI